MTADELHIDAVVIDCHNDFLIPCSEPELLGDRASFERRWIPELEAGGVDIQIAPVFAESRIPESSLRQSLRLISALFREVARNQDRVEVCRSAQDLTRALETKRIGLILALEGGTPFGGDADLVRIFFELGVRMISLTHMGRTLLADGSAEDAVAGSLSRAGIAVVEAMEELGIVVDISHLGLVGTDKILSIASRPLVASHSSARALCDHHRNLTDEHLRAIAALRGVVGVTAIPAFVRPERPTIDDVVDHIEYIAGLVGIEHVGLGPDFIVEIYEDMFSSSARLRVDGARDARERIDDYYAPRHLPNLTRALVRRGFSEPDIRAVLGENFLRVFSEVMGVGTAGATDHATGPPPFPGARA